MPATSAASTTSVTAPTDPRPRATLLLWAWLGIAGLAILVRLPFLAYDSALRIGSASAAVGRVASESVDQRITRASGISGALADAIRSAMPEDGRLVLYSPYGGAEFERDAADPRGEPARQVRTLYERVKNLLYPQPRDVIFARDAAELLTRFDASYDGRLIVLDGTQGSAPLTVGGEYELLHQASIGSFGQLRLWRLLRAK